jgi:hypothetical protein
LPFIQFYCSWEFLWSERLPSGKVVIAFASCIQLCVFAFDAPLPMLHPGGKTDEEMMLQ